MNVFSWPVSEGFQWMLGRHFHCLMLSLTNFCWSCIWYHCSFQVYKLLVMVLEILDPWYPCSFQVDQLWLFRNTWFIVSFSPKYYQYFAHLFYIWLTIMSDFLLLLWYQCKTWPLPPAKLSSTVTLNYAI